MKAVIISHNQKHLIEPMNKALTIDHVFVFDRCMDRSESEALRLGIPFITNAEGEGRQCSRARNMGADYFPNDDIMFLDADRIPLFDVSKIDMEKYNETLLFLCEDDLRITNKDFSSGVNTNFGYFHNSVFACGMAVKRSALNRVKEKYGVMFDPCFTKWGEEDRHFGDLLYDVGSKCDIYAEGRISGITTPYTQHREDFIEMTRLRVRKMNERNLQHLIR